MSGVTPTNRSVISSGGSVSDAVYGAGWNGDTTIAPSKNAVYDKVELLSTEISGKAPSLGADDNYVTDAEKVVIGNTSGTNTGDEPSASDIVAGVVELAIASEVTTGTDTGKAITPDALAGSSIFGVKAISVQVVAGATALTTGDGKAYIRVPASLNGMNITAIHSQVIVKSTSGTPTIQVARGRQASATSDFTYVDVLSTLSTIDANEYDSKDATTPSVVNASNDDLATGDVLRIDVDTAGTGTSGLQVSIECQLP